MPIYNYPSLWQKGSVYNPNHGCGTGFKILMDTFDFQLSVVSTLSNVNIKSNQLFCSLFQQTLNFSQMLNRP